MPTTVGGSIIISETTKLSVEELKHARMTISKEVQLETFLAEIKTLRAGRELQRNSK